MHLGYRVARWVRAGMKTPAHAPPKWKAFGGVGGCNSGALVGLSPLWTNFAAAAFVKLQRALTLALPQPAGLNPIAFRLVPTPLHRTLTLTMLPLAGLNPIAFRLVRTPNRNPNYAPLGRPQSHRLFFSTCPVNLAPTPALSQPAEEELLHSRPPAQQLNPQALRLVPCPTAQQLNSQALPQT